MSKRAERRRADRASVKEIRAFELRARGIPDECPGCEVCVEDVEGDEDDWP